VIELSARDFSFWDVASSAWLAEPGLFKVHVGRSSRRFELEAEIELTQPVKQK
jgi:hypothetical protein